jgi:hypothetical protein
MALPGGEYALLRSLLRKVSGAGLAPIVPGGGIVIRVPEGAEAGTVE